MKDYKRYSIPKDDGQYFKAYSRKRLGFRCRYRPRVGVLRQKWIR